MAKFALLIGVSEYDYQDKELKPLLAAVKDVEAMQRVLVNPEMGEFPESNITVLKNPQRQEIEEAIENLFNNRQKDDLLLFYFSGHGIKDDRGLLYLSTRATKKLNGKLAKSSAVAASFLHSNISDSRSQRQVLILDCCFSGAISQGMTVKSDGTVNVQEQLGGKGRAILTSSTSAQYSFEQEGSELSIYTRYLVEGIETGAADKDNDGSISIDELHEYASTKVQEAAPAMTPKFYPVEEGHKILLAKSPKDDPKLKYRKEVENRINRGKFSIPARRLLNSLRVQFKLIPEIADAIEAEVQQPYREYQRKLEEYEATLVDAIADEATLSETTFNDLRDYQQHLGLRDEDVASIEKRIIGQPIPTVAVEETPVPPQNPANQFEFEVVTVNAEGEPINRTRKRAEFFRESLGNGVLLEMVAIPGGEFLMGSPENEPERYDSESPQHTVTVQPFFMGKYPVTQSQWAVVAALKKVNIDLNSDPSYFKGANLPVENVSWDDAIEFCARLSNKAQKTYRLPSEAEWEYACRAGRTTPFYFGETITTDLANYRGTDWDYQGTLYPGNYGQGPKGEYREQTTDVGKFPPNPFALFDMHGNIWEWCQDGWHKNYNGAPADGSVWMSDNNERLLRGGSWDFNPRYCRSALRYRYARVSRNRDVGFRVVVAAPLRT
ncbi:SUMF1/EgtB/PvdO family nonheme iron enzyme [Nostoc sp. CHAB 5715]|uniref:caspase, EACC1-associated type n=1 Tax=Nostoc sp. CHAB 5715 TaxID=2780400 RepID=UPI001E584F19|nr:SUMF1/EgtB/PvdO family nonheme iron enzyme [Nostoc sp. CHAB 5715]MCC5622528.1 SUMF1/EgtB/PvdO family nonheme iron enzyme [Nostoc sp. CHAB 5715]